MLATLLNQQAIINGSELVHLPARARLRKRADLPPRFHALALHALSLHQWLAAPDEAQAAAVDLMAAAPLLSATSLAAGLGVAVKNATRLLDGLRATGVAVEVTHRSKRRLFALSTLAPLREGVAPPRRPVPGRGRPRTVPVEAEVTPPPLTLPERPLSPVERHTFDCTDLAQAMALADQAIRHARRVLDTLVKLPQPEPAESVGRDGVADSVRPA